MIWPNDSSRTASIDPTTAGLATRVEAVADAIRSLEPHDECKRALQTGAVDLAETMLQARWLATAGTGASVPVPFLVVLFVCALSIGGALFLVLEMDGPFDGLLRVSPDPLAYSNIKR